MLSIHSTRYCSTLQVGTIKETFGIFYKENGGYGIGMNIGLEMATGEYIGIVEPDDFVPVNMFGNLYDIAKGNNLDFVKADFYRFERATNGDMFLTYNHLSKKEEDYNVVFNPRYCSTLQVGTIKETFGIFFSPKTLSQLH